ncbi:N-acetylmuramoyl-L-alanine amidase [Cardiobacterium sp. Marseille-Q4385]|uniref:N-acetylmuramoyl-L-alanine amidase n=1 Tax=Cardiobacterium sp. Marseille-Q4385 TaxID=2866573 RepID=UPI001CE4878A|nr:N-acetylmuramoyl-L-alanine amidase [Cardiobacterium sp. Marseille-Q4385]
MLILLGCSFFCYPSSAWAVVLQDVRYNRLPDKIQLVLDLDRPTIFQQFSLAGPPRIVLDIPDASRSGRAGITIGAGAVNSIRTGFSNETTLRVVIDLRYTAKANIYTMPPEGSRGNRIVIDIYDNLAAPALTLESLESEAQPPYVVFAGAALENMHDNGISINNSMSIGNVPPSSGGGQVAIQPPPPPRSSGVPVAIDAPPRSNGVPVAINAPPRSTGVPVAIDAPPRNSAPPPFLQNAPLPTFPQDRIASSKIVTQAPPPRPPESRPATVTVERKISATGKVEKQSNIIAPASISKKTIVVAIDPGHGGKDTGAVNPGSGLREKDVVLQIAHRLKQHINSKKGFSAFLTRSDDTYIPLPERPGSARRRGADLFISIHADAVENSAPSGSSVYILSTKGATTAIGKYLERTENSVDLRWGVDVSKYDDDIQQALLGMQQEATIESSYILAQKTLNELGRIGKVHKGQVQRANFVVLRSPDIPSMLVETAFISNPDEARKLASPTYQEQLAQGIANGVVSYYKEHLPQHMLLGK